MANEPNPLDAQLGRRTASALTREKAFLTILAGALYADNKARRAEMVELEALLGRVKTLQTIPEQDRRKARDEVIEYVKEESIRKDRVALACQALVAMKQTTERTNTNNPQADETLTESAFAHACDIICTDHEVHNKEREYLQLLERELQIAPHRAELIFKTLALKNEF